MMVARFSSTELITPYINHAYFRHSYIRPFHDEILTAIFVLFSYLLFGTTESELKTSEVLKQFVRLWYVRLRSQKRMAESSDLAVYGKGVYKQYGKGKKVNHVLKGLEMEFSRNIMLVSVQISWYYY